MKTYTQFLTEKKTAVPKVIRKLFKDIAKLQGDYNFSSESFEELITPILPDVIQFIQDFLPAMTNITCTKYNYYDEVEFYLADYPFSVKLGEGLFPKTDDPFDNTNFYLKFYALELKKEQITAVLEIFLQTLRSKIVAEPGFYTRLSPRLQAYFQAEGQHLGHDFGFLEALKTHDQFGRDEVKHQEKTDKENLTEIYKQVGTNSFGKLNTDLIFNILWRNLSHGKIIQYEEFDNSRFRILYDLWTYDIYFTFKANIVIDDIFFRGRQSLKFTEDQFRQLTEIILMKVRAEITVNPNLYQTLPKPLQNYFQTDFKHLGVDFDFLA
jgi:hypothetical protein